MFWPSVVLYFRMAFRKTYFFIGSGGNGGGMPCVHALVWYFELEWRLGFCCLEWNGVVAEGGGLQA